MGAATAQPGPTVPKRAQSLDSTGPQSRAMFFLALVRLIKDMIISVTPLVVEFNHLAHSVQRAMEFPEALFL